MDNKKNKKGNRNFEKVLNSVSTHTTAPKWLYLVIVLLYIVANVLTSSSAGGGGTLKVGGFALPTYAFAGIFSAMGNLCIVIIVVFFGKLGFYTALACLLIQFPMVLNGIIIHHNLSSLPGLFTNLLTIITIIALYINNRKIDKYQRRIRDQAITDELTGLPNRFACTEFIESLIKENKPFTVVSIDINNFKSINDTMGHTAGNEVLNEIADRWKSVADSGTSGTLDFVARTGGDEFVLIIRDYRNEDEMLKSIRHYESVLGNRLTIDDCDLFISASFGGARFPEDADSCDSLFSYANAALYEVKRKNSSEHILMFTPDLLKIERTIEIERKIREALDNDTLFYNLQPQFDISHKLRGFEALARMKDSDGKFVSPGEFIPVAEKVGLIDRIDACVFRKSAEFIGKIIKETGADITLSVNVSVRHLMKNDFIEELKGIIAASGVTPDHLEIEITESIMIDSAEKALNCINDIKNLGIKIAIDDFGTGYSSLNYLNTFPADLLKVDKSFIDKMNSSDSSKKYVAAIISIGHIMNFEVISEGVEEPEQLETLKSIGCDFVQGYIWGKPLPPEDARELVMNSYPAKTA